MAHSPYCVQVVHDDLTQPLKSIASAPLLYAYETPDEGAPYMFAVHRRLETNVVTFLSFNRLRPAVFGTPVLVPLPTPAHQLTGDALYEHVWIRVRRLVDPAPSRLTVAGNRAAHA
jgi:hypothetical protein